MTETSAGVTYGIGDLTLYQRADAELEAASLLQPVWENGKFLQWQTFEEVRQVLNGGES